jgi:predicted dinucleotide-binding enzyme
MKIALLGGGNVGGALGTAWSRHGHEIYFGVIAGAEVIAKRFSGAKAAKCFNITGANNMANLHYRDGNAAMFACSDYADTKATAMLLASDAGFEIFDLGPLAKAGLMESFARLWIWLAYRGGLGREFAFRLVKR